MEVHTPETAEQLLAPCNSSSPSTNTKLILAATFKGLVDVKTLPNSQNESTTRPAQAVKNQVHLSLCENVDDFEAAARTTVSEYGRAYINSAADSLYSVKNNRTDWQLVTFRPRVMRNVLSLDTTTKMLGHLASSPFFIAPTGMAGLIHPEAETLLVHGAVRSGIHYCISGVSTRTPDDMMECFKDEKQKLVNQSADPAFFYQIYVNSKEEKTRQTIEKARDLGFKALVITADTPVPGKREEVNKYRAQEELNGGLREYDATREGSEDQPVRPGYDPGGLLSKTLCWDDIAWMRELFQGPIVVKGIQCAEDAKIAADLGVDGIYLSNHGGRQLDYSPSSIMILLEIRMYYPEVFEKCEVYLDGGIRRGTDIVKALCLGATSVGIGRPFLYAMGAYGTRGLLKANSSEFFVEALCHRSLIEEC